MNALKLLTFVLLIVDGSNWGLAGFGGFLGFNGNLVNLLLSSMHTLEWTVYILVDISAIVILFARMNRAN